MTESYPWENQGEIKPVDCAGCLWGEQDRPAKAIIEWSNSGQKFKLKTPEAPNGWIKTEDNNVDLAQWR